MNFKSIFIILSVVFLFQNVNAQKYLNLDFEKNGSNNSPKGWMIGNQGYSVFVDSTISFSGKKSLCIQKTGEGDFGVANNSFPVSIARGKHLKYSGYIKTDNIKDGYAGLWWRGDGSSGVVNFDNMSDRGPKGTTDWTKYSIELKVDDDVQNINFGVLMPGDGKAWFDNLQIELDGKVYEDKMPETASLSPVQLEWLKNNTYSFDTAEPTHNSNDLSFLKSIIGDARIVSLGEGTHGTSEFFKMKHRITKYLAEEMGFTVFAIEANMPEAKLINDYILTGNGDSKKALAGLYFWTWNTQEVLEMIEWMRAFNASGKGKIEFYGFDMQFPKVAIANVLNFIKQYDKGYFEKANDYYKQVISFYEESTKNRSNNIGSKAEPYYNYANEILGHVLDNLKIYEKSVKKDSVEWALQNTRIVTQCIGSMIQGMATRDECMAYNTEWILEHTPKNTKIVLWAHNGHVQKMVSSWKTMGRCLNERYGKEMVVFGFGFHEGNYTAVGKNGLGTYTTSRSQAGSLEWNFHMTGKERLCLDLRKLNNSPLSNLLTNEIDFRSIGAMAMDEAFSATKIAEQFDAVIYFDKTTPSACFRVVKK